MINVYIDIFDMCVYYIYMCVICIYIYTHIILHDMHIYISYRIISYHIILTILYYVISYHIILCYVISIEYIQKNTQ